MNPENNHLSGDAANIKGKEGEIIAYELAKVSFLKDWCFANPKYENGTKELCDLLIIFDDSIFIWQIKNVKLEDGYYKERHKTKNINQLLGAYKQLFVLNTKIELPGYGDFDQSKFKHIFLCSVFMGEPEFSSAIIEEVNGQFIHTIHKDTLDKIVNELDTVSDFIAYYKTKESFYQKGIPIMVTGGEEELLALYVKNNREIPDKDAHILIVDDGIWENLQQNPQYNARNEENKRSFVWDHLIETLLEESKVQSFDHKLLTIELLKPTRFYRRVLSKCFLDLIMKATKLKLATLNRYLYVKEIDNTAYCFMYADAQKGYTAAIVQENLEMSACVVKYLYPESRIVIGIACITLGNLTQYTYMLYDGPGFTKEDYEYYSTELGRTLEKTEVHEEEYPI